MSGTPGERGRIVVGVDGSESSKAALRWALRQAELTDSTVHAVTAWEYPPLYGSIGWLDAPQELTGDTKAAASRALDHAIEEVVPPEQVKRIHRGLAYGTPAVVLLDRARGADLLVVGSHGHGGFAAPRCAVPQDGLAGGPRENSDAAS
ncbi:universal stress protein [Streptomyces noursei]|uniref:universal stress protein n=1 Tax=Streptomyces noursei TaxID=1971 RepID=UPI001E4D7B7A|nr:universal stress protein [Streptomyces noursei]